MLKAEEILKKEYHVDNFLPDIGKNYLLPLSVCS